MPVNQRLKHVVDVAAGSGWENEEHVRQVMTVAAETCNPTALAMISEHPYSGAAALGTIVPQADSWTGQAILLNCVMITYAPPGSQRFETRCMTLQKMFQLRHIPLHPAIAELSPNPNGQAILAHVNSMMSSAAERVHQEQQEQQE
jgi:hypothetical protein